MALRELCIHLTKRCNQNCGHCYYNAGYEQSEDMKISILKEAIYQAAEAKVERLTIQGGEPFLYKELEEVCKLGKEKGMIVAIPTNGQLINSENINWIKMYVDIIYISIHGAKKYHDHFVRKEGAYEKAINSIRICTSHNVKIGVLSSVSSDNYQYMHELSRDLDKLNVDIHGIIMHSEVGRGRNIKGLNLEDWNYFLNEYSKLRKELKHLRLRFESPFALINENIDLKKIIQCLSMEKKICFLDVNGDCYYCSLLMDDRKHCVSNITESNLSQFFRNVGWDVVEKKIRNFNGCSNCNNENICKGGCLAKVLNNEKILCKNRDYIPKCILYPDIDVYEEIKGREF